MVAFDALEQMHAKTLDLIDADAERTAGPALSR